MKKLILFIALVLMSSQSYSEQPEKCTFEPLSGTAICTKQEAYQAIANDLESEINDFIRPLQTKIAQRDYSRNLLLESVRKDFSDEQCNSETIKRFQNDLQSRQSYKENSQEINKTLILALTGIHQDQERHSEFALEIYSKISRFIQNNTAPSKGKAYSPLIDTRRIDSKLDAEFQLTFFLAQQLKKHLFLAANSIDSTLLIDTSDISEEDLKKATDYLSITWIHGTTAFTLRSAHNYTDDMLLPFGFLFKNNVRMLSGKMDVGASATGINQQFLSGLALGQCRSAIYYSQIGKFLIERELFILQDWLTMEYSDWESARDSDGEFLRLIEAVRRIKNTDPSLYEFHREDIIAKLNEIYTLLQHIFDKKPRELFRHHDEYFSLKLYRFLNGLSTLKNLIETNDSEIITSDEDQALASIGIVVASSNRYGIPIEPYNEESEQPYFGGLKLGEEIQVVFTADENVAKVQSLLDDIGLGEKVNVESLSVLKTAGALENAFLDKLYNVYEPLSTQPL